MKWPHYNVGFDNLFQLADIMKQPSHGLIAILSLFYYSIGYDHESLNCFYVAYVLAYLLLRQFLLYSLGNKPH